MLPTWSDPVARAASTLVGGPWGRHGLVGRQWFWTPLRVCLGLALLVLTLAWLFKSPCRDGAWTASKQYTHMCYSDVVPLFFTEHLNIGAVPYRDHAVEYPVLTGGFMYVAAVLSRAYDGVAGGLLPTVNPVESYFDATALLLACCALVMVWAVTRLTGRRVWDAAMVALSPVLVVHAFTNWDLFAVALATLALVAWQTRRPLLAGVLVGLGTAAKLYPVLFLVPLALLCWRTRRWRELGLTAAGAVGSWLLVNLPVALAYPDSWLRFFTLNETRPADPDSLWNVLRFATGRPLDDALADGAAPVVLNTAVFLAFAAALAGVAVLTLTARRQPRLSQLLFLVVAAFLLTNKVWSPQYSLWLVPLAVLARPSWRAYLAWQATEALLWFPRMYWYLGTANKGVDEQWFLLAVLVRDAAVLVYCALVVRDILSPDQDVVRSAGSAGSADDPAGGVLADRTTEVPDDPDDSDNPDQSAARPAARSGAVVPGEPSDSDG